MTKARAPMRHSEDVVAKAEALLYSTELPAGAQYSK